MKKILYVILCTFLMVTISINTTVFHIQAASKGEVGYIFYTDKNGNNPNENWESNLDDAFKFTVTAITPNMEVSVYRAYGNCVSGDIIIPSTVSDGTNTYNVTSVLDGAFYTCESMTGVVIPGSINLIGDGAFNCCVDLAKVSFKGSTPPTIGSNVFYGCDSNLVIDVPAGSLSEYRAISNLSSYNLEESITSWADLQASINDAVDGATYPKTIKLTSDISATTTDSSLVFPTNKKISLDLYGHTLNRNLASSIDDGYVMKIESGASVSVYGNGTITGGYSSNGPGAIYNNGATLDITNTTISNNYGYGGGALYNDNNGTIVFDHSKIEKNVALSCGGAIYNKSGTIDLKNTEIDDNKVNSSSNGGGIYTADFVGFTYSKITNCTAPMGYGGGVYVESGGRFEAVDGIIEKDSAEKGGGIYVDNGGVATLNGTYLYIIDCTGDGIYTAGVVGLETCTISNNDEYGVYISNTGRVFVGGSPKVVDNNNRNVVIVNGGVLTIGSGTDVHVPTSTMKLGIATQPNYVFTTNDGTDYLNCFESDDSTFDVFSDSEGKLFISIPRIVKFETNGGSTIDDVKVAHNHKLTKPANPVKTGYKFDGWYSDVTLNTPYDFNSFVDDDFTLYAKWSKNKKPDTDYTVPNTGIR